MGAHIQGAAEAISEFDDNKVYLMTGGELLRTLLKLVAAGERLEDCAATPSATVTKDASGALVLQPKSALVPAFPIVVASRSDAAAGAYDRLAAAADHGSMTVAEVAPGVWLSPTA